jgi:DNA processing protein
MPGGVDICHPATRRALFRRLRASGCLISELPCGCRPGCWAHAARTRIGTALADMVIVVEAGERPIELLEPTWPGRPAGPWPLSPAA